MARPDIAYIPTPYDALGTMLQLAQITPTDCVYDLGCGDGRFVIEAARQFGATGVGIDIDPDRIAAATAAAAAAGVSHQVSFRTENLYDCDLRPATVVVLYLLPHLNLRLRPRLWQQLRPGARVVSHQFDMGDWPPNTVITLPQSEEDSTVYQWTIPPNPPNSQ